MSPTVRSILVAALAAAAPAIAQGPAVGGRFPAIVAEDVAGAETTVRLDTTNAVLIGVTDREHRTILSHWFKLIINNDSTHLPTRYSVVTLPGAIPTVLHGTIRGSFPKTGGITYLLDWGGKVSDQLGGGDLPIVFIVSRGTVRGAYRGEPDSARVQSARAALVGLSTASKP
jgi:hypothetical protein